MTLGDLGYKELTQNPTEWSLYLEWIKEINPRSYLEIGAYWGFSLQGVARVLQPDSWLTVVEAPTHARAWEKLLEIMDETTKEVPHIRIDLIKGSSRESRVLDRVENKGYFDICFIDASHDFSSVWSDFENYGKWSTFTVVHDIDERLIEKNKWKHNGVENATAAHFWKCLKRFRPEVIVKEFIDPLAFETPMGIGIFRTEGWLWKRGANR